MSQNDFNIANQGFPSFRSDLNGALQALASNSAGTSAPATTYAYMWWYDSTNDILKMRNADNDAWIDFATFDQANDRWAMAGSGDTGLYFDAANDALLPWNTDSGVVRDSAIDLGSSSARFKNLTLSGGVYLGGTGAANLLDDVEFGTFTPVFERNSTQPSVTYTGRSGYYTKVGDTVFISIHMGVSSWSGGSGSFRVNGLPFTVTSGGGAYYSQANSVDHSYITLSPGYTEFGGHFASGATAITMIASGSGVLSSPGSVTPQTTFSVYYSGHYRTAS